MRNIIVSEFMSLDGVIQAPGGADEDTEGNFALGGWTHPYWHDDIGAYFGESMSKSDAFLLGRKTWQIHGGAFEPMEPGRPVRRRDEGHAQVRRLHDVDHDFGVAKFDLDQGQRG